MDDADPTMSRRAEYSRATVEAIVTSARSLFRERTFFGTKVDDIAKAARVSPATVYSVAGGKQGLLETLIDRWTSSDVVMQAIDEINSTNDPEVVLELVVRVARQVQVEWGDVIRVVLATAPADHRTAMALEQETRRYRDGLRDLSTRFEEIGKLRVSADEAADVLWYYVGYHSWSALTDDLGWSHGHAEEWILQRVRETVLKTASGRAPGRTA